VALCVIALTAVYSIRNWRVYERARNLKNPVVATGSAIAAGKHLYADHCQKCHGVNGDGRGPKAAELSVAPGDFTNVKKIRGETDGELFWQITKGRFPMPSFEDKVSAEGRWELVDYIRTFAGKSSASRPAALP
jgi:mono/diheme cytochrome c family protein